MRFIRALPIRIQLFLLATATVLIVVLVIFISFYDTFKAFNVNAGEFSSQIVLQNQKAIISSCEQISKTIYNVAYNQIIQDYLVENDQYKLLELNRMEKSFLANVKEMNEGILDIRVFRDTSDFYSFMDSSKESMDAEAYNRNNRKVYFSDEKSYKLDNANRSCFIAAIEIFYTGNSSIRNTDLVQGAGIGAVVIVIDSRLLGLKTVDSTNGSIPWLNFLDRNGKVYSASAAVDAVRVVDLLEQYNGHVSGSQTIRIGEENYIVQVDVIPPINGRIVSVVKGKDMLKDLVKARWKALIILFSALLLLSIPFLIVINNIVLPLKRFMKFMTGIRSGNLKNLKKRVELEGYAEIMGMAGEFNNMLDEIDTLAHRLLQTNTRLYETELTKKQAELAFMESQINPHFLYNTLESVKGIALVKGAEEIWDIAQAMGRILRYGIKGAEIVALEEELNIVKAYIQIQQIRFVNRFEVEYLFADEDVKLSIPKMILQPIVENAIYHGIEPKARKGLLRLSGHNCGNDYVITVYDNGAGMQEEKLEELRRLFTLDDGTSYRENTKKGSIGLSNVDNRLKLLFGREYGLEISSMKDAGTEVIVRIPAGGIIC